MTTQLAAPNERPSRAYGRRRVRNARVAVSSIFFQQGLLVGGWAFHIPFVIERLAITESVMGLVIVVFGTGSILTMLSLGPVMARLGSRGTVRVASALSAFFLLAVAMMPGLGATMAVAFATGGLIGATDVAMNAQGIEVERRRGRPIMSSFHAYWSVGTLIGALVSGALIAALGPVGHAALFGAAALGIALLAWPHLVRERVSASEARTPFALPRAPVVWLLGIACMFSFVPEGAAIDWSVLFMREEVGASLQLAGLALAGLQVTMTVMRFLGDALRARIGPVATLRWGGLIAAIGFVVAGLGGMEITAGWSVPARTALVVAGFMLSGIGLANIVPVVFSAAGEVPGVPTSVALSIVAMHGYAGILLAPSLLGWVGERIGFAEVFVGIAALPFVIMLLARAGDPRATG